MIRRIRTRCPMHRIIYDQSMSFVQRDQKQRFDRMLHLKPEDRFDR